jgi:hypothetical protein
VSLPKLERVHFSHVGMPQVKKIFRNFAACEVRRRWIGFSEDDFPYESPEAQDQAGSSHLCTKRVPPQSSLCQATVWALGWDAALG